jgi:RNA polymerase sigma-70 factor (ECF subfamily)
MAVEQALVRQARAGDQAAFRELVSRYEGLVAATVTGMLGPGPEAEDVGQNTFIRFYQALGSYRGEGGVAPYLTRIAINLSLNALGRRKRWRRLFLRREDREEPFEPAVEGEGAVLAFDRQEVVRRALDRLPPKYRAVVVLRLIDGYSTQETADLLGVPLGTVLSRLARAQQKLKDLLRSYLTEP